MELAAKGEVSVFRRGHSDSRYVNIELTDDHGELKPAVDMAVTVKVEGEAAELAALGSAKKNPNKTIAHITEPCGIVMCALLEKSCLGCI